MKTGVRIGPRSTSRRRPRTLLEALFLAEVFPPGRPVRLEGYLLMTPSEVQDAPASQRHFRDKTWFV
jgi:hypothetical protein